MGEAAVISGGFAAPVFDAQRAFAAAMNALARPGTVQAALPGVSPPAPLNAGAAALVAALCDADTPVWLDDRLRGNEDIAGWIGFHAGAPVAAEPGAAQFAVIGDPQTMPALERFAPGSQEYPDRSATIILQIDTLQEGSPLVLTGPGIETSASIAPAPMPPMFVQQWQANRALFPRGIDVVLATYDAVAGLPRSVMIEEG